MAAIDARPPVAPGRPAHPRLPPRHLDRARPRRRRRPRRHRDPPRLAGPLAVRDRHQRADGPAARARRARARRAVRARVDHRHALHRAPGRGDDRRRAARGHPGDHRPRLDHRHGPVPARPGRPVPRRASRCAADAIVVGRRDLRRVGGLRLHERGLDVLLLDRGAVVAAARRGWARATSWCPTSTRAPSATWRVLRPRAVARARRALPAQARVDPQGRARARRTADGARRARASWSPRWRRGPRGASSSPATCRSTRAGSTARAGGSAVRRRDGRRGRRGGAGRGRRCAAASASPASTSWWRPGRGRRALTGLPVEPRKGQLVAPGRAARPHRHKLFEASYLDAVAGGEAGLMVAAVIEQTLDGDEVLVGSSRERVGFDPAVARDVTRALIERARALVPALRGLPVTPRVVRLPALAARRPAGDRAARATACGPPPATRARASGSGRSPGGCWPSSSAARRRTGPGALRPAALRAPPPAPPAGGARGARAKA